jgi:hypothetical protein
MNRRAFLGTVPFLFAGCSRPAAPSARKGHEERARHLEMLRSYRVEANAQRTTPKAAYAIDRFPELKPLAKVAIRLHPRFGDEPALGESKLGGAFLWPADEPWPTCPEYRIPMSAVVQMTAESAPPQFPFKPKSDLFQLFWTPRATKAGPPHVVGVWRSTAEVRSPAANPDLPDTADLGFVPVPCRLIPERVVEFPPIELMPKQMRDRIEGFEPIAIARGTKLGGWPRVPGTAPKCTACVWPMDFLLTVDSCEWTAADAVRGKPVEDRDEEGFRRAAGFDFGKPDAVVQVFLCRRCEHWPLRSVIV